MHICQTCHQIFNQKSHYTQHLNRINKCEEINWNIVMPTLLNNPNFVLELNKLNFFEKLSIKRDNVITIGDFFAGIGTSSHVFDSNVNFKTVYANDMEPKSKIIYDYNNQKIKMDCRDLNPSFFLA